MQIDPPPEYDDVNEAVVEEWKQDTTTRERIRSVVQRIHEPTSAAAIAERAHASEPAVRDTLADLEEIGLVETQESGHGTLYKRNEKMYIFRQVVELQKQYDETDLVTQLQDLKDTVNMFRDEYGVESPTELAQQLEPDDIEAWDDHTAWQTAQQNLYLVKVTLSFYDAQRVVV